MKLTEAQLRKLIREELLSERSSGDKTLDAKIKRAMKALSDCANTIDALDTYLDDGYLSGRVPLEASKEVSAMVVLDEIDDVDESVFSNLRSTLKRINKGMGK